MMLIKSERVYYINTNEIYGDRLVQKHDTCENNKWRHVKRTPLLWLRYGATEINVFEII